MAKEILKGREARLRVKAGVDRAANAVAPTLGAVGMTALIEWPGLDPVTADDGITILRNLEFADPYENMGLQLLKKGGMRSSAEGGDGTATTTVLTQALAAAAFEEVGSDSHKIREVRERLDAGLVEALAYLNAMSVPVEDKDIERIAEVSSLDADVATLVAQAVRTVGSTGAITVEKGAKLGYYLETVKGMRFEKGLISPYFINDPENTQTVLIDPYIILVDRTVSLNEQIIPLLSDIGVGTHILLVATDVAGMALASLAKNAMDGIASIACVMNPYNASPARDFLFDLAALTGATVVSEEKGMRLEDMRKEICGRAEKIVVTRDRTTVIGGKGTPSVRIKELQSKIEETTSDFQKGELKDRLAALTGGIGVIRVGVYTDTEYNAKKYKFDNAVSSTQAAMQEGVLPGGGVALMEAGNQHSDSMFSVAMLAPFNQMCENAGMEKCKNAVFAEGKGYGIDFVLGETVHMMKAGIVDPHKVVRTALESAVAITKHLINFETAITVARETTGINDKTA